MGIACAPQSSFPRIDVARFVENVQKESYPTDSRVKVAISSKSPSSAAALAYVNSVVKEGLCGKAAEAYIKSILNEGSKEAAVGEAMRAFIRAFKQRANKGATLNDEACHKASRAFFDAVPQKSDPIIGAGFTAFSDKLFAGNGVVYDPVCLEAMESFIDSHSAGDNLLTSSLKAARSFLKAFISNPQKVPADSPCASATLSFAQAINTEPSSAA